MWKLGKTSQPRETGMKVEKDTHTYTQEFRFLQAKERGIGSFAPIN